MLKIFQLLFEVCSLFGYVILWLINNLTQSLFNYSIITNSEIICFIVFVLSIVFIFCIRTKTYKYKTHK